MFFSVNPDIYLLLQIMIHQEKRKMKPICKLCNILQVTVDECEEEYHWVPFKSRTPGAAPWFGAPPT